MSNENEYCSDPSDSSLSLFLVNNSSDELTDILVAALDEAFWILDEEIRSETAH